MSHEYCTSESNIVQNLVAGIAGLGSTVVRNNKITNADTVLPTSSLTDPYTLCWTFAALFANATLALNSVAGDNVDLSLATVGLSPTIIIAAPGTIKSYIDETNKSGSGPGQMGRYFSGKSLKAGVMPVKRPTVALRTLSSVRLILIGQPVAQKSRLSSQDLHELRQILGARVGYAFTAPKVAGAISQTNIQDYRNNKNDISGGPPLGSVEVNITGPEDMGSPTPRGNVSLLISFCHV